MRSSRVAVLMGAVSVVAGMLLGEIPTGQAATGPVVVSAPAAPAGDSLTVQSFNDYGPVSGTSSAPGETVIPVSGMPSTITDLSVYLPALNVHALSDAHVPLGTPEGTAVDLIELACFGSSAPVVDHDFIVDDRAASPLPHDAADSSDSCWIDRGVIQPSDYIFALPSEPTRFGRGQWPCCQRGLEDPREQP